MSTLRTRAAPVLVTSLLVALAACAGQSYPIEVKGSTGMCSEYDSVWSGDVETGRGLGLPGTALESKVSCTKTTASDERLSGAVLTSFRCEFSQQGEDIVGECVTESTVTNDGGTWRETGDRMTITGPREGFGLGPGPQPLVVMDGVREGTGDEGTAHTYPWTITGTLDRAR